MQMQLGQSLQQGTSARIHNRIKVTYVAPEQHDLNLSTPIPGRPRNAIKGPTAGIVLSESGSVVCL